MAQGKTDRRWGVAWLVAGLGMAATLALLSALLLLGDTGAPEQVLLSDRAVAALTPPALGGLVCGIVLSFLFGRTGLGGWLLALVGGAVATLAAGAVGAALAEGLADPAALAGLAGRTAALVAAARALPQAIADAPILGLLWATLIGGVHTATGWARTG